MWMAIWTEIDGLTGKWIEREAVHTLRLPLPNAPLCGGPACCSSEPGSWADGQSAGYRFKNQSMSCRTHSLRFLQNLHKRGATTYILQPIVLSTMWVKLLSVVTEFCFSPFLVTDQGTASNALESSSLSSQDPRQRTSPGKCHNH